MPPMSPPSFSPSLISPTGSETGFNEIMCRLGYPSGVVTSVAGNQGLALTAADTSDQDELVAMLGLPSPSALSHLAGCDVEHSSMTDARGASPILDDDDSAEDLTYAVAALVPLAPPAPALATVINGFGLDLMGNEPRIDAASTLPKATAPTPVAMRQEQAATGAAKGAVHRAARNLAERISWSEEEDAKIIASVREHGQRWRLIASLFDDRSDDAVRNRWSRIKHLPVHNDGRPAPPKAEPKALKAPKAPKAAKAAKLGGKRPRASHADDPDLEDLDEGDVEGDVRRAERAGERLCWSREEDALIVRSVGEFGHRWHKISERLSGRTEHAIRNRYARLQFANRKAAPRRSDSSVA